VSSEHALKQTGNIFATSKTVSFLAVGERLQTSSQQQLSKRCAKTASHLYNNFELYRFHYSHSESVSIVWISITAIYTVIHHTRSIDGTLYNSSVE
jgi:hypothetical protein